VPRDAALLVALMKALGRSRKGAEIEIDWLLGRWVRVLLTDGTVRGLQPALVRGDARGREDAGSEWATFKYDS
jgi:hypothetical protein